MQDFSEPARTIFRGGDTVVFPERSPGFGVCALRGLRFLHSRRPFGNPPMDEVWVVLNKMVENNGPFRPSEFESA